MTDTTISLIEHWKRNAPRPKEQIPFASVMQGLSTSYSAVDFKEETIGRWSVRYLCTYDGVMLTTLQFRLKGERKLAEFSFAGVVAYADDEKTGNLVPDGEEVPISANGRKRRVVRY